MDREGTAEKNRDWSSALIEQEEAHHQALFKQRDEHHQARMKQDEEHHQAITKQKEQQHLAFLQQLSSTSQAPIPPAVAPTLDSKPVDRWTMPFLVGVCSGLVWIMQNGYVPFYNSFGANWLGMFYGPALIGYLIYFLGSAMETKRYHSDHPEAVGLRTPQLEKINTECTWLGLKVALSLLGAQVMSRIFYANGLAQVIEKSMGGWSGRLLETMPIEFHIGMMIMSAIGFACCFAGLSYYQKGKLEAHEIAQALGIGLFAGAGVYIAHLLPGMNHMYGWHIPEGIALCMAAFANGAVLTAALAMKPSLVDVSGLTVPTPEDTSASSQQSTVSWMYDKASQALQDVKTCVEGQISSFRQCLA